MTFKNFSDGDALSETGLDNNFGLTLRNVGLNYIKMLEDRSLELPADGGVFGEAYVDSNGQQNSVDTTSTTSIYGVDLYTSATDESSTDTTYDPNTFTNVSNAFDNDNTTYSSYANPDGSVTLGKTFSSSKTIKYVFIKCYASASSGGSGSVSAEVMTYDGSVWSSDGTLFSDNVTSGGVSGSFEGGYLLDSSVQGIAIKLTSEGGSSYTGEVRLHSLEYGTSSESVVYHSIPSGTFSSTLSNSFLTFDSEDWESGADVQYKLTNTGGDDSGWLNSNEIQTFTAFTAEPDTLQVKLIPKTTSPTAGTPSIRGVYLTGDKV